MFPQLWEDELRLCVCCLLCRVLKLLRSNPEHFSHLLTALQLGSDCFHPGLRSLPSVLCSFVPSCPPHGGLAIGMDRLVAIFASEPSNPENNQWTDALRLRDVVAFPKSYGKITLSHIVAQLRTACCTNRRQGCYGELSGGVDANAAVRVQHYV